MDLAVIGEPPSTLDLSAALSAAFSESDLPWTVDVVDWAVTTPAFRRIIERNLVVVQQSAATGAAR
jgi:hypothetical protein